MSAADPPKQKKRRIDEPPPPDPYPELVPEGDDDDFDRRPCIAKLWQDGRPPPEEPVRPESPEPPSAPPADDANAAPEIAAASDDVAEGRESEDLYVFPSHMFDVTGTCMELEKPYKKWQGKPSPAEVRPYDVLRRSFELIGKRYEESGQDGAEANFGPARDQLLAILQEIECQEIPRDFTAEVLQRLASYALYNNEFETFQYAARCLLQVYSSGYTDAQLPLFASYFLLDALRCGNELQISLSLSHWTPALLRSASLQRFRELEKQLRSGNRVRIFRILDGVDDLSKHFFSGLLKQMEQQQEEGASRAHYDAQLGRDSQFMGTGR